MNDDYDYRATFDFSQSDLAAIDKALAVLEEKFSILDDVSEEDIPNMLPYFPRDEAFIHRAIPVLKREWDVFVDDDEVDVDEIRGHMLSVEQLRPRLRRLRDMLGRGEGSLLALLNEAHDACMMGVFTLERLRPALRELPALHEAMTSRGPNVMRLLPKAGDVSLLDEEELGGGSAADSKDGTDGTDGSAAP